MSCSVNGCPHSALVGQRYCAVHEARAPIEPAPGEDPEHDAAVERIARRNGIPGVPELPNAVMLGPVNGREVAEALGSYLNSQACMLLFSKLTLYRACGENPKVVVTWASGKGLKMRISLRRSSGEVEHFNRDGES